MERMVSFLKLPEAPILPESTTGFWTTMIRWNVDSFWEPWKNRKKVSAPELSGQPGVFLQKKDMKIHR